ncbi:uncharacterized protein CC84DRAFT_1165505 [Paraphaeosphaeria sporulosa]|uniref:Uncharacterized protein n=1 Tax=Paraphaeosphaeria sporulosa TaxID=1460663 RepID=A0A177CD84_9PLEO|nr:uncharacterized protein CC84DRAFT_1165505 [Paraphaeosphaeria sporulosa]OAG05181.1 hypothetical protein CC84DRAFT_1165505 [Paraphaeosphaeria sporulosa]
MYSGFLGQSGWYVHSELIALTSSITDTLPAYMVPTMFILVDSMPLAALGQIAEETSQPTKDIRDVLEATDYQ